MEAMRRRYGAADYRNASGIMRAVHVVAVNETYEDQLAGHHLPGRAGVGRGRHRRAVSAWPRPPPAMLARRPPHDSARRRAPHAARRARRPRPRRCAVSSHRAHDHGDRSPSPSSPAWSRPGWPACAGCGWRSASTTCPARCSRFARAVVGARSQRHRRDRRVSSASLWPPLAPPSSGIVTAAGRRRRPVRPDAARPHVEAGVDPPTADARRRRGVHSAHSRSSLSASLAGLRAAAVIAVARRRCLVPPIVDARAGRDRADRAPDWRRSSSTRPQARLRSVQPDGRRHHRFVRQDQHQGLRRPPRRRHPHRGAHAGELQQHRRAVAGGQRAPRPRHRRVHRRDGHVRPRRDRRDVRVGAADRSPSSPPSGPCTSSASSPRTASSTAKSEIFETAEVAMLNVDDDRLAALADRVEAAGGKKVVRASAPPTWPASTSRRARRPPTSACAVAVARELGVPDDVIAERVPTLPTAANRLTVRHGHRRQHDPRRHVQQQPGRCRGRPRRAAPAAAPDGRRVVVTPGMVELGPRQADENATFAEARGHRRRHRPGHRRPHQPAGA